MTAIPFNPSSAKVALLILGMLCALPPLATDAYLPGFHLLAQSFGVGEGRIQATLSVFFLGLSAGQAIYGPLIDRYGRRGPLLIGVGLYIAATLLCLLTSDIAWFTALRFIQAIGGCAGMVIGRAIVNDLFDQRESARALSLLMVVMTLAPIVAPLLGGLILAASGWRMIFVAMLGFGAVCGLLAWFLLPETLPPEKRRGGSFTTAFTAYGRLLARRAFMVPTLVGGFAQGCMFAFITGSPVVFVRLFGVDEQTYGWLFGLVAVGLIVAAQINRFCLSRWSPQTLLGAALLFNVAAGLALLACSPSNSLVVFLLPLWFAIASLGFIGANSTAIAMNESGEDTGSGSALIGVLQFGCAFAVSSLVALSENGSVYPMTMAIVACGALASLLWLAWRQ